MKLETTITQLLPIHMTLMPQLTLPELPPLLAAPRSLIPALNVVETARITPLRQAFFSAPVASDFKTNTASVSLPQQFDLTRTHPLLASAAAELARLWESAQTISSFVFAKPAVVSGMGLPSLVIATVETTDVAVEKISQVPMLHNAEKSIENVARTNVIDKTDSGSLIENVVRTESMIDKTDGGSLIKNDIRAGSIVDNNDGATLIENAARAESVVEKTDDRTFILNSTIDEPAIVIASPKGVATQSRGYFVGLHPPRRNDVSGNFLDFQVGTETGAEFSFIRSLKMPNATTQVIQEKAKLMSGALSIKPKAEPLLAKFGPLGPVLPGGPLLPRGRFTIDLRATILPLEDRKAAAKGESKNKAAAKIDEMNADGDSQGSQDQDGELQQ